VRGLEAPSRAVAPAAQGRTKSRAAGLSIASNAALIVLKIAAGAITGSIAILTEAVHSAIDLLASVVAFFSVRKAEEPPISAPTPSHRSACCSGSRS
jgi:divalent metal cation (Fe/Co/Zn/Cd) transporter